MIFKALAISLALVGLTGAEPTPYKLGMISMNTAFGIAKRQAGYQPGQTVCGSGTDCASACGATYVQCPSTDSRLHCFDPSIKESCCPDGTGNSCDAGYYCTSDTSGGTWCCPDGMDLAACAAAYSLTDSLVSQTAKATYTQSPSSIPTSVAVSVTYTSADTSATDTSIIIDTSAYSTSPYSTSSSLPAEVTTSALASFSAATKTSNATVAIATTSVPLQVTGGANSALARGGVHGLVLAAGALLAL